MRDGHGTLRMEMVYGVSDGSFTEAIRRCRGTLLSELIDRVSTNDNNIPRAPRATVGTVQISEQVPTLAVSF